LATEISRLFNLKGSNYCKMLMKEQQTDRQTENSRLHSS